MKYSIFFALGALGAQTAHFTFNNADSSKHYNLTVVADGTVVKPRTPSCILIPHSGSANIVDNRLAVHHIDAPDYCLRTLCKLSTAQPTELKDAIAADGVTQQVVLNPPTQVLSISCKGDCVPTYGECYKDGQYVGPCCNGFCAANRCRPWNTDSQ